MKIYRYICKDEYKEIIEKNILRFWDPTKWGVNEGSIQRVLEKRDEKDNRKIIELIKLVAKFANMDLNTKPYKETLNYKNSIERIYCDIYTELVIYYKLCITSFCQCWTKNPENVDVKLNSQKKYIARIEWETSNQKIETLDNNGKKLDWIIRNSEVFYKDYSYKDNIEDIIKNFNENGRKFSYFIKTIQNKHHDQNEIRFTATLTDLNIKGNKLTFPLYKYDDKGVTIDDLANELHEMSMDMKKHYEDICFKQNDNRYIYVNAPKDFVKSIKLL